jgi:ribonucleases P/MRP protein subunit RPP40
MLCDVLNNWYYNLSKTDVVQVDVISIDWSKAFDSIPHDRLGDKLWALHIRGNLLNWIKSFLSGRTQRVIYGGSVSESVDVTSGVPQGSVIGPLLFAVFMLDLPNCIKSNVSQYADDSTISRPIKSQSDVVCLQDNLNSVAVWCKLNRMELNPNKSSYIRLSRSQNPINSAYTIQDISVPQQSDFTLLGIKITSNLKWNMQTENVRKKGAKILGMLGRCFFKCKFHAKRMLYISLVRSVLSYGAPAWHPSTVTNCNFLERIQGRATRFILGHSRFSKCDDSNTRLIKCNLPSVCDMWKSIDIKFLACCFSGKYDFDVFGVNKLFVRERRPGLRGSSFALSCPRGDASYLSSYFPRVVAQYNALPAMARIPLPI